MARYFCLTRQDDLDYFEQYFFSIKTGSQPLIRLRDDVFGTSAGNEEKLTDVIQRNSMMDDRDREQIRNLIADYSKAEDTGKSLDMFLIGE